MSLKLEYATFIHLQHKGIAMDAFRFFLRLSTFYSLFLGSFAFSAEADPAADTALAKERAEFFARAQNADAGIRGLAGDENVVFKDHSTSLLQKNLDPFRGNQYEVEGGPRACLTHKCLYPGSVEEVQARYLERAVENFAGAGYHVLLYQMEDGRIEVNLIRPASNLAAAIAEPSPFGPFAPNGKRRSWNFYSYAIAFENTDEAPSELMMEIHARISAIIHVAFGWSDQTGSFAEHHMPRSPCGVNLVKEGILTATEGRIERFANNPGHEVVARWPLQLRKIRAQIKALRAALEAAATTEEAEAAEVAEVATKTVKAAAEK